MNQQLAGILANQNQHIQQIPQNQNGYDVYSHYQVSEGIGHFFNYSFFTFEGFKRIFLI